MSATLSPPVLRVIRIPEIMQKILNELSQKDIRRLAVSNRQLSEPTLNFRWKKIPSVLELLRWISARKSRKGGRCVSDTPVSGSGN